MTAEKRDALVRSTFAALVANGARTLEEYQAEAEQTVRAVVAEALRNAAERLSGIRNNPSTYYLEFLGLDRAVKELNADAATLDDVNAWAATRELDDAAGAEQQPAAVVISMTREDARELGLILDMDRRRMDKGDDRPVPQPRWGANVRVSKAVAAALDSTPEG